MSKIDFQRNAVLYSGNPLESNFINFPTSDFTSLNMSSNRKSARKDPRSQPLYTALSKNENIDNDTAFSDSEAVASRRQLGYYQLASSLPDLKSQHLFSKLATRDGNLTDDDQEPGDSYLDIGQNLNKNVRTGRQRKKLAARSKGGEFQTKRRKRRVYFCCISSEIDLQKLLDYLQGANDLLYDWKFELHNDVLHLYKPGTEEITLNRPNIGHGEGRNSLTAEDLELSSTPQLHNENVLTTVSPFHTKFAGIEDPIPIEHSPKPAVENVISFDEYLKQKLTLNNNATNNDFNRQDSQQTTLEEMKQNINNQNKLLTYASKEVFVFDFGAAVFWGFSRGEEVGLLKTIRMFVTKGMVGVNEFEYGEDDMAFVISPEEKLISIANDVISFPEDTLPKQRMAVSFAIAQSSVLAIFEARIEQKVDEYKYIPEALAAYGKVHLSERQLGMMIGEVFVIRHDVNLHTEILGNCNPLGYFFFSSDLVLPFC